MQRHKRKRGIGFEAPAAAAAESEEGPAKKRGKKKQRAVLTEQEKEEKKAREQARQELAKKKIGAPQDQREKKEREFVSFNIRVQALVEQAGTSDSAGLQELCKTVSKKGNEGYGCLGCGFFQEEWTPMVTHMAKCRQFAADPRKRGEKSAASGSSAAGPLRCAGVG